MENKNSLATILFTPSGIRGRVKKGTTILEAAQKLSVDLNSICGARGQVLKMSSRANFWRIQQVKHSF